MESQRDDEMEAGILLGYVVLSWGSSVPKMK